MLDEPEDPPNRYRVVYRTTGGQRTTFVDAHNERQAKAKVLLMHPGTTVLVVQDVMAGSGPREW